jgi:Sporulation lipoprotein YhcN/YlaJ (Spore_YhcN_YlaJ)
MKKGLLLFSLTCFLTFVSGCADGDEQGLQQRGSNIRGSSPTDINYTGNSAYEKERQFGYVRYNKSQLNTEEEKTKAPQMDREEMANIITRTLIKLPNIEEAATLVTDEHALIAYTPKKDDDREQAADIVRRTAEGLLPRWIDVYISDQETAYQELQSLSNNRVTEKDNTKAVESIIKRFTQNSPQGSNSSMNNERMDNRK